MFRKFGGRLRFHWNRVVSLLLPVQLRFYRIYKNRHWGGRFSESASGLGSSLAATTSIRAQLPSLLRSLDCTSLLDIGCGDFNWMRHVELDCRYIGVDIVEQVISQNQLLYGSPMVDFQCLDASSDLLPVAVDVVLCREVLFHLSFKHALALVSNVGATNSRFFIATHIPAERPNSDTYTGGFRPLDLRKKPFAFPEPINCIQDDGVSENRRLCVWRVDDLPAARR